MDEKNRVSDISQAQSLTDMATFWDEHDTTMFEDRTYEVDMTFDLSVRRHYVAIDPALLQKLQQTAMARGLNTESLINLWLQERLSSTQV
ncbi:MAG: hypothetical protein HXY38_15455 [Chloroflexi bacterium]|nr:hypothetical protein [Chloroflexota bacterium]